MQKNIFGFIRRRTAFGKMVASFSILALFFSLGLSNAKAEATIANVTLNGEHSVSLNPGDEITVKVYVDGLGQGSNWKSTNYSFGGGNFEGATCINHPLHNNGSSEESFEVTVPDLEAGEYDFSVEVYHAGNCNQPFSLETVNSALVIEEEKGSITIIKEVSENVPENWSFDFTGSWDFSLSGENNFYVEENLDPGEYEVSEALLPENWSLEGISCSQEDGVSVDGGTINFNLSAGQEIECKFINTFETPQESEEEQETVKIVSHKVICGDEKDLPQGSLDFIGENTAFEWAEKYGCDVADNWEFQWAPAGTENPGDNLPEASRPWMTFGSSLRNGGAVASVDLSDLADTSRIWMREVGQKGFLTFSGVGGDLPSAEFYCHDDALNFDNYDFIENPVAGETYHCTGWSVLLENNSNDDKDDRDNPSEERRCELAGGIWSEKGCVLPPDNQDRCEASGGEWDGFECQFPLTPENYCENELIYDGDLIILLANWGTVDLDNPNSVASDFNMDGNVGVPDLLLLLSVWGETCEESLEEITHPEDDNNDEDNENSNDDTDGSDTGDEENNSSSSGNTGGSVSGGSSSSGGEVLGASTEYDELLKQQEKLLGLFNKLLGLYTMQMQNYQTQDFPAETSEVESEGEVLGDSDEIEVVEESEEVEAQEEEEVVTTSFESQNEDLDEEVGSMSWLWILIALIILVALYLRLRKRA